MSTRFSPSMENKLNELGAGDRTCLARPNSQPRTGTGKKSFPCSADHKQDWQPDPMVYPYSAESADYTYTYTSKVIPSSPMI